MWDRLTNFVVSYWVYATPLLLSPLLLLCCLYKVMKEQHFGKTVIHSTKAVLHPLPVTRRPTNMPNVPSVYASLPLPNSERFAFNKPSPTLLREG